MKSVVSLAKSFGGNASLKLPPSNAIMQILFMLVNIETSTDIVISFSERRCSLVLVRFATCPAASVSATEDSTSPSSAKHICAAACPRLARCLKKLMLALYSPEEANKPNVFWAKKILILSGNQWWKVSLTTLSKLGKLMCVSFYTRLHVRSRNSEAITS
jgi:hypothetical protein